MTKEQFYLHTLADHWQEMGYPYAADLLRHHANEGVPAFREIVGGSPQVSERAPQGGGPVIFGTPDLGGGHNQAKLTFYHVHPDGQQQRLGSVGFTRPEGHAVMRTLQAAGHKGAEIDAARTLPEGWKAPKAHQSFLPTLNTARPEAPEQDYRPNEVLPEDYYSYSRARLARAKARHDGRKAARKLAKRLGVDPAADADPYLFPEERDTVLGFKPDTRQQFGDMVRRGAADRPGVLPGVGELKSLAQVGDPVRGSYEDAFTTVLHLLKNPRDAHRWVAANAILSAQTAWEKHTAGATKALAAWHAANRPTDKAGLDRVFSPTGRNDRNASILTGDGMLHKNNVSQYTGAKADALKRLFAQGDDFDRAEWGHISEGSYKTPNFGLAFIDPRGGPIDTHMLKLTVPGDEPVINPKKPPLNPEWTRRAVHLFAEKKQLPPGTETPLLDAQKKLADRPAAVMAYKVLTVQAARELGWEVRQVQEAVWTAVLAVSVAKHLGARDADEALKKLTRSAVQAGWSLNTVLRHPEVVRDLAQLGVPTRKIAAAIKASERRLPPGPGPVRTGDLAAVDSAARRLPAGIPTGAQPIYDRLTLGRRRMAREKPLTVPIHAILPDKENLEVAADSLHRGHRSEDTRPLEVYRVGKRFVLADGHHRLLQAILAGDTTATVSPRETDRPPGTKYTVPLDPDADLYGLPDRLPRNGWLLKRLKLGRPYRAPAGGTVVRGVFYVGGSMIPDLAGPFATGQTPSRPAPPPKSRKINWAAALRRWTGRQRNR